MKKYRVIQACVGRYFDRRFWEKDTVFEVEDSVDPNDESCFELVTDTSVEPTVTIPNSGVDTFSQLQKHQKAAVKPNSGFGKGLDLSPDEPAPKGRR